MREQSYYVDEFSKLKGQCEKGEMLPVGVPEPLELVGFDIVSE